MCQSPTVGMDTAPRQPMKWSDMLIASDEGQSLALCGRYECSDGFFLSCKGLREILASRHCGKSLVKRYENQLDHLRFYFSRRQHRALHFRTGTVAFIGRCVHVRDLMNCSVFVTCELALNEVM